MARWYHTSGRTGSMGWLFMRISGIVLVALVVFHYMLMHGDYNRGHTFKSVYDALTDPVWGPWFKTLDLTMVTLALWHGLTGTWGIVRDYRFSAAWRLGIFAILVIGGIAFGTMGFATILSF